MEPKRLFLAIPITDEMKKAFTRYLARYKKIPARWVEEQNYHVTTLFLGDTAGEQIPKIQATIKEKTASMEPFKLIFDSICFFPDSRHPHMIWAKFQKSDPFTKLVKELGEALGIEDEKESIPHVTLARLKHKVMKEKILFPPLPLTDLEVKECHLMASKLSALAPVYTLLERFELCKTMNF